MTERDRTDASSVLITVAVTISVIKIDGCQKTRYKTKTIMGSLTTTIMTKLYKRHNLNENTIVIQRFSTTEIQKFTGCNMIFSVSSKDNINR